VDERKRIIVIFIDKKTNEYNSFQAVDINEKFTVEKINEIIDNWNNNEEKDTKAKIYNDPLLAAFINDVYCTRRFNDFIDSLTDRLEAIRNVSRDICYESEALKDFICESIKNNESEQVPA